MTTLGHPANSGHRVDINTAAAVARHARFRPHSVAIVYEGGDLTYAELNDRAARLSTVLTRGGIARGDRVAYLGLNSPSFLVTMLASFRLGAIFVPINFRLAGPELQSVLTGSGAHTIICEEGHRAAVDAVAEDRLTHRILVDDDPAIPVETPTDAWTRWSAVMAAATPTADIALSDFDDPAILMFTSGTTGLPKGVVLTHGNAWWNSLNVELMLDSRPGDTTHAAAPIFHVEALNSFVMRALVRGNRIVLRRTFEPQEALDDYVRFAVRSTFAVPAMFQA